MISIGRVKIDRIPEYFFERYADEIAAWANSYKKLFSPVMNGSVKSFILKEGHLADPSPDPEQGAELIQVKLIARMSIKGVEIEPLTVRDEMMIRAHCRKLQRAGLGARQFTPEPPRPGLPFLPNIHSAEKEKEYAAQEGFKPKGDFGQYQN